jgi:Tfp pilus assembly protein PilV
MNERSYNFFSFLVGHLTLGSRDLNLKTRFYSRQRGLSLIEVAISVLLTSIGLLSLAQLFSVTVYLNGRGRNNTEIARAAQVTYENLLANSFSAASLNATSLPLTAVAYDPGTGNGSFLVTTQITDVSSSLKRITVTVVENNPSRDPWISNHRARAVFVSYRTDTALGPFFSAEGVLAPAGEPQPTPTAYASPTPTPSPTPEPTLTPTPSPTPTLPACSKNQKPLEDGCTCQPPMAINQANGKCQ